MATTRQAPPPTPETFGSPTNTNNPDPTLAWGSPLRGSPPSAPVTGNPPGRSGPPGPRVPTPTVGPAPSGPVDPLSGLPTDQRNAYASLQTMLQQYGLESLAPQILNFVKQGYTGDALNYLLSQTPEYKQRFAGNDLRIKNGLAPLSPADYLNTEAAYRQVLQASGLPSGFYDSHNDFNNLIGSDISATELQSRAQDAYTFTQNAVDPNVRQAFQTYYGVNDGHLAAYFLDPKVGTDVINRQVAAAQIGGAAQTNGLDIGKANAERYANLGVTYAQAQSGAAQAGLVKNDTLNAAQRFGVSYNQQDLADTFIGGLASAQRKQRQLSNSEGALFAGTNGNPGQLSVNSGGAY
ncbi:MAG: hypothetical protein KGL35_09800 [Bradyrhizobium sp.]|nr:hypothetical protein [Bradyrhizobium sp.]